MGIAMMHLPPNKWVLFGGLKIKANISKLVIGEFIAAQGPFEGA